MKTKTSILSRCMAMLLALVLSFANVPGLVMTTFAADYDASISAGKVMAENYDVTDAEKALLSSGYLAGDYTIEYNIPGEDDNLIEVDAEEKIITAKDFEDWTAVSAETIVDNAVVGTTTKLADGKWSYSYEGNAFSVKVNYVYSEDVRDENDPEKMLQGQMLDAMEHLKDGVANLDAVADQMGNLFILEEAMPKLVELSETGVETSFTTVALSDECKAAISALDAQMDNNGGVLNLSKMINEIGSKTAYVENKGAAMQEEVADLVEKVTTISTALNTIYDNIEWLISGGYVSETLANQIKTFAGVCSNLATGLATVNADPWYAANNTDEVFGKPGDATLDALVAALGDLTPVATTNPLKVAETSVTANMAMKNVTVNVVLNVVKGDVDSAELVAYDTNTVVIPVDENATAEQVVAKVKENGIEADSLAEWAEVYVDGKYTATTSTLPETLAEDITYTITYNPVDCAITGGIEGLPTSVPYGYVITLPVHEDANDPDEPKAYDYTVNGKKFAQGSVVTVEGDTVITREEGKSYQTGDLYSIVAGNFANDAAKDILTSGALKGNVVINYRQPDPTDTDLVKLENNQVTAEAEYPASYADLNWAPYTYGVNGTENSFFGNTAAWAETSVKARYVLNLINFGEAKAQEIIDLAATLKEEADAQTSVLDRMAAYYDTMGQLDKTKLGALNGVIDVTDFSSDAAKNDALKAYFKTQVSSIIANNLDSNNQLKIYNMLGEYNEGGLGYYYENSAAVINEINTLSTALSAMLADDEKVAALEVLVGAAGYPEYAEKIANLEGVMTEVKEDLTAPNVLIDLGSKNLGKLITALTADGTPSGTVTGSPYIVSPVLTAADASQVYVQVIINNGEKTETVTSEMITKGNPFTAEIYTKLINEVNAAVENVLVGAVKYYDLTIEGVDDLAGLIDINLMDKKDVTYNYTPKTYEVIIDGETPQTVTVEDLTINLPKHPETDWEYRYTVNGVDGITASTYDFKVEQIDELFKNGTYTITRVAVNTAEEGKEEQFQTAFGDWIVEDAEGNAIALYASIDANKDGLMSFVGTIVDSHYTYIGLNGEAFLDLNADDELEITLQTLINAILADNQFGSETLIDLGNNGKGDFVHAKMQYGNSSSNYEEIDFTLNLKSVPAKMATVANGLEEVEDYLTFNSNDGVMDINVNLPEKVYEVYLAALLATGNVDKNNMNEINDEIALMFFWDYLNLIVDTEATTTTYTNTLKKLGVDKDLTGAEDYYQLAKKALKQLDVNEAENDTEMDVSVTANGKKGVDGLVSLLGIDISSFSNYLAMVYEYKDDGHDLTAAANVNLVNTETDFEAAVVDVKQPANKVTDHLDKFDFTKDLSKRVKTLAGEAAIILLDTVDGDLVFDQDTILDLNGHTVDGSIVANAGAKVLVFDSSLDTFNCGVVEGTVSGDVTIVGGKYTGCDVTGLIPDGYVVEDGVVRNVLYTIEEIVNNEDVTTDVFFKADADIIDVLADGGIASYTEAATAIAADMAVDLVLNYFTSASLTAGGFELYNITLNDIIGIYDSTNRTQQLIDQAIEWVSLDGLNKFINEILKQMLAFGDVETAIHNDDPIVSFAATVAPWSVTFEKTAEDYLTFGIAPNDDLAETFNVGLVLDGSDAKQDYAEKLFGNLAEITETAEAHVEILKPSYNNKHLTVRGEGDATFILNVTNKHLGDSADYNNEEYINVLAVVLANGVKDATRKQNLVDAIENYSADNTADMKAAIDALTVKDVFDAFKELNRNDTFAKIASDLRVDVEGNAEDLEEIYHLIVVAAGKALDVLDVTGPSKTIGSLYNSNSGYYELTVDRSANKSVSRSGYTITVGAEITELTLKVKLFDDGHSHTEARRELVDHVDSNCFDQGYDKYTVYCACGHHWEEKVDLPLNKDNHKSLVIDEGYDATCSATGLTDGEHCDACGTVITEQQEIPVDPNGHNWYNKEIDIVWEQDGDGKWTCKATHYCEYNSDHYETAVAAITTSEKQGTCCEVGSITYTARFNEDWVGDEIFTKTVDTERDSTNHAGPMKEHIIKRATYTETGLKEIVCDGCGATVRVVVIPKLSRPSDDDEIIIDLTGKNEDEENPSTGAPVKSGSALCAMAVLAGAAFVAEAMKKH